MNHRDEPPDDGRFEGRTFLLIRDDPVDTGVEPLPAALPGWLSPDIVVVKPDGTRGGEAIVGRQNGVEVTVHNRGGIDAVDAEVEAFVCGPSTGWTPTTAMSVGSGFLTIPAYTPAALLFPWTPGVALAGHNCLMARVRLLIPPDTYLNPLVFDVRGDRHVAQRNIEVLTEVAVDGAQAFGFRFLVADPTARGGRFVVRAHERALPRRDPQFWCRVNEPPRAPAGQPLEEVAIDVRRMPTPYDIRLGDGNPPLGVIHELDDTPFEPERELGLEPGEVQLGTVLIHRPTPGDGGFSVVEIAIYEANSRVPSGGLWLLVEH